MPRKVFVAGEILTAADVNTNLMDQAVMVFDDDTARTTAIPSPVEGMVTYRKDAKLVEVNNGTSYVPVGGILQVVSTAKTDVFSTSSTSYTDVTGFSVTITPSSTSSKILVMTHVQGSTTDTIQANAQFEQRRDSTTIHVGDASGSVTRTSGSFTGRVMNTNPAYTASWAVLDTPSTTSAVTYSVRVRTGAGTAFVNRSVDFTAALNSAGVSSITVMEVAG